MLPGFCSANAGGDFAPANTLTYKSHQSTTANTAPGASHTFSAVAIGTATSTRIVICAIVSHGTGGAGVGAVTVGGISATYAWGDTSNPSDPSDGGSIWYAVVPTGTTADIVITIHSAENTSTDMACGVYTLDGYVTSAPYARIVAVDQLSHSSISATLSIPKKGAAVWLYGRVGTGSVTWTNATEQYDSVVATNSAKSGALNDFSAATESENRLVTATPSVASTYGELIGVSWR